MLGTILDPTQEQILKEEREWLSELRVVLEHFDVDEEDGAALQRSIRQLDELFLLVIVGEFNSGKSAFINALIGEPLLEEGVTPTTTRIHLLKHGPTIERKIEAAELEIISAPVDLLREINVVDTPGTNAIHRQHEAITREFVPRSDMVLFVTSADRPFTESERIFLERIQEWGKKVVMIVNKIDILEKAEDVERICQFIADNVHSLLGFTPNVFPVSARYALKAKTSPEQSHLLEESGFPAVEEFVAHILDEKGRLRLKLLNPLGVGTHMAGKYAEEAASQLATIKGDLDVIDDIDRQLQVYTSDMRRDFRFRLAEVDNILHGFESRGIEYFDETMRLARVLDLVNKAKLKSDYQRTVVEDVPQQIEQRITEIIDWVISSELRQWQAVMDRLNRQQQQHADRIVGQVGGSFEYDRTRLLETVGRTAMQAIESYDHEAEAARLADSIQRSVAGTALVEASAIGLGTIVTILATTALADITGIVAASALAVLGLFVIPARRQQAKQDLRARIAEVRQQLMAGLTSQFDRELERSQQRMSESIAPYTRFIRAERDRLKQARDVLTSIRQELDSLRARIQAI
jgi:small GTP-binding protein